MGTGKGACLILMLCLFTVCRGQLEDEPPAARLAGQAEHPAKTDETGLLFYLSGDRQFTVDYAAGGQNRPNFLHGVKVIPEGAIGPGFEADNNQLLSYWAPGNIYAQRGTLSFFWRSRYPVGPTPFPIFRVAYADHSSWDMAWMRIDYNGGGIDAFVTDAGLSRTRVSYYLDRFPAPVEWTHIALSWDETEGIRLYINGEPVAKKTIVGKVYDAGLDQFGPHSRIISPYQVQSFYSFQRGGDLDELRIYDRMLTDEQVEELSAGKVPAGILPMSRDLNDRRWRDEWWDLHGWNLPNDPPAPLPSPNTIIRKVGIHEAVDVKRWIWKANDGIRETTWPGVYNMSRLPGRYDYFVYPDWDCYSVSGQTIRFSLPDEPWNHVEIWGRAWGQLALEREKEYDRTFSVRSREQVKSSHDLDGTVRGGVLRFDNALIEEPIGELGIYHIHEGRAPEGSPGETFRLVPATGDPGDRAPGGTGLESIAAFVRGRYPADEREMMVGVRDPGNHPGDEPNDEPANVQGDEPGNAPVSLPFIHLLLPYGDHGGPGLDGVEISLPGLPVKPTHGELYPLNIRVKDPIWPMRDLADVSFSVRPGEACKLYIDTRDRLLPEGRALYVSIAGAGYGLSPEALGDARIRLVYKTAGEAKAEHVADRFTQIRDLYGFCIEERPLSPRLNLYNRFMADYRDLIKADPGHWQGRAYLYALTRDPADRPEYPVPSCPPGTPEWAFLQAEYLSLFEQIVTYYIDKRQIANGEFGGGLSDDDDFTYGLVGSALMGVRPQKIRKSLKLFMEAYYDQDRDAYDAPLKQRSLPLSTNGMSTIHADELHCFEEGLEALGQLMVVDYGNPLYISRAMENATRILNDLTGFGPDGHRYFRSRYYSSTGMSTEEPWQWSQSYSYLVLQNVYLLATYTGNPDLQRMIVELAEGLLAHRDGEGNFPGEINFNTGEDRGKARMDVLWPLFYTAFEYTRNEKYLGAIPGWISTKREFNRESLADYYRKAIAAKGLNSYIDTEGSVWIDRVYRSDAELEAQRLGGTGLVRVSHIYPVNHASWEIAAPGDYRSLAIFSPEASSRQIKMIVYNLEDRSVEAKLSVWKIEPGRWSVVSGKDRDGKPGGEIPERTVDLVQGDELAFTFAPGEETVLEMKLVEAAETAYRERPDLAICREFARKEGDTLSVRVYSQGAVAAPASILEIRDAEGNPVRTAPVPAMEAPLDLVPRWVEVRLAIPEGCDLEGAVIRVDPERKIPQITYRNTVIRW